MSLRLQCLAVDSIDPQRVAAFWEQTLGWRRTLDTPDEVVLQPPPDHVVQPGPDLLFLRVPKPQAGKNRVHLDLRPDDQAAEVERVKSLGARPVEIGQEGDESWVVLADPEGNEFCILRQLQLGDSVYEGPAS